MKYCIKQSILALISLCTILFFSYSAGANNKTYPTHISQEKFLELSQQDDFVVIDVRTRREFTNGYIPKAINIPHKDIINGTASLEAYNDKNIIFYCHTGVRVGIVTRYLENNSTLKGEQIYHLKGDYRAWRARGRAIIKP